MKTARAETIKKLAAKLEALADPANGGTANECAVAAHKLSRLRSRYGVAATCYSLSCIIKAQQARAAELDAKTEAKLAANMATLDALIAAAE